MEERILIAGFGGQGVLSMGQMIAYAGMLEDKFVSWLPSYGAEMRGGTSNCSVIVADEPVSSPMITADASCAMVLNRPSLDKFEGIVRAGGLLLINSSLIDRQTTRDDAEAIYIPCNAIAHDLGNERVANVVMLGAFLKYTGAVHPESVLEAIPGVLGPGKEKLIPVNRKALEAGAALVKG